MILCMQEKENEAVKSRGETFRKAYYDDGGPPQHDWSSNLLNLGIVFTGEPLLRESIYYKIIKS